MVVAEEDITWEEEQVGWVALEMRERLDKLACEDPSTHALQHEGHTVGICEACYGNEV
jgi:hypothetical protein